ncbi:MAG TPA: glycosyltransferase [Acidimicrobiales bacterium]|nr:glycosyltransferase [Acidimicrobiales bacterium]
MSRLALVPLLIWIYLLVGHGRFWRTDVRLPHADPPSAWPSVAVVVPARDEGGILAQTLPTLLAQDYPGAAHLFLVDDRSTDGTAELATTLAAAETPGSPSQGRPGPGSRSQGRSGPGLTIVAGAERPPGWAGKLWAVEQGVRAATAARAATGGGAPAGPATAAAPFPTPAYLLLTDADIAHPPDSLRRLVAWAEAADLDEVSLMARLRTVTGWERLLIPAFVYFFAELYPFRRVNRPARRTAAAAGGCVLVRASALERAGGVSAVRGAVIDDVALARSLKASGATIWLGLADDVCSVRPYPGLGDLWDMVARSAFTQLRYSTLLLAGTVVGLAVTFLGAPAALVAGIVTGDAPAALAGAGAWLVMAATYVPMIRYYRLPAWRALTLPAVACLYAAMTVTSAVRHWRGGVTWKGRSYSSRRRTKGAPVP